jgi:hypothetical protein
MAQRHSDTLGADHRRVLEAIQDHAYPAGSLAVRRAGSALPPAGQTEAAWLNRAGHLVLPLTGKTGCQPLFRYRARRGRTTDCGRSTRLPMNEPEGSARPRGPTRIRYEQRPTPTAPIQQRQGASGGLH